MTYENRGYRDVFGIAWLGCGLFTLLCVISFSPTDVSMYTTHPTSTNFIGPAGAHWAALLVFSLGLASYAFPALAFYLGLSLIFRDAPVQRWSQMLAGLLLLVSIAGLLHLQPYMGWAWAKEMNTISPGGFLGHTINSYILTLLFGPMGACFSLVLIYAAAFSAFFDLQPRRVMREVNLAIANHYRRKEEERLRRATPKDLLEMKQKEITAQMKKLQQQLGGPGSADIPAPAPRAELPLAAPTVAASSKPDRRNSNNNSTTNKRRDQRDAGPGFGDGNDYRDAQHDDEPELAVVGASASADPYASADAFFSGKPVAGSSAAAAAPTRRRPAGSGRSAASLYADESEDAVPQPKVTTTTATASVAPSAPLPRVIDGAGLGTIAKARPAAATSAPASRPAPATEVTTSPTAPVSDISRKSGVDADPASFISEAFGGMAATTPAAPSKASTAAAAYKANNPVARSASPAAPAAPSIPEAAPAAWPADSFFADDDTPFASGTGIAAPVAPAAPMYTPYGDERYMPKPAAPQQHEEETPEETDGSDTTYEYSTQEVEEEEYESDDDNTDARNRHAEDADEDEETDSQLWYEDDDSADQEVKDHHSSRITQAAAPEAEPAEEAPFYPRSQPAQTPPQPQPPSAAPTRYAPQATPAPAVPATTAAQAAATPVQRPVRTLGSIGVQAPRPFGPGTGSGTAAPAPTSTSTPRPAPAVSSPAPVQSVAQAPTPSPVASAPVVPTLGSTSPRPGAQLPALFRGIEKRPTAVAPATPASAPAPTPLPAPVPEAPAFFHTSEELEEEEDASMQEADINADQDSDTDTDWQEDIMQHQAPQQTQPQSFAPARPAAPEQAPVTTRSAFSGPTHAQPQTQPPYSQPQQHPAAGMMHRAPAPVQAQAPVPSPAPAPAPLRPAPLPQSPEVQARRERERDARNAPSAVPSVRLPGVGLPPDGQAQRKAAQRPPFDPFEIVPEFEQPPKPAFVAAQSAVSAPPASAPAQYSAAPARPNQPVAGTPPQGNGGNSRAMLSTTHAGDSSETLNFGDYTLPTMEMLSTTDPSKITVVNEAELQNNARLIVDTLKQFGIQTTAGDITRGATITRYELYPAVGVRVDKILALRRDIARTMRAERIQILAPIPGKNTVGVEIANKNKVPIVLRDLFESPEWNNSKARIPIALGKDVYGQVLVADLADMPHMLVAGTTGSGKSVCINSILLSFLYRFRPDELRLILVDPKQVEMAIYNTIPHLVVPVVTDPKKVLLALRWVINEMEKRYKILAKMGVRNIGAFNNRVRKPVAPGEGNAFEGSSAVEVKQQRMSFVAQGSDDDDDDDNGSDEEEIFIPDRLPYIVVVIDELADLMLTAPADVESAIARITAKARAAGIHLIVATQSPRKDVVTGIIKANIPSRIAFQVANSLDSRIILDESGAENLVGKGDLLYLPPGTSKLTRGQGAFVSDEEVNTIVQWCSAQAPNCFEDDINNKLSAKGGEHEDFSQEDIELIHKCWDVIRQEKRASTSMLQRRLRLGYNKAAWVVDFLERILVLGPGEGAKPREILVDLDDFELPI